MILEIVERHSSDEEKLIRISLEFSKGLAFLRKYKKAVTFFGSAVLPQSHRACREAYKLAYWAAKRGYVVITGGGGSVMEAANRGARDAGGISIGILIRLPEFGRRELRNKYLTEWLSFKYFFVRKFMLSAGGEIYFFFPGGFGTMDELYEMATLVQTEKIPKIPIILVDDKDRGFWFKLLQCVEEIMVREYQTLRKKDLTILHRVVRARGAIAYVNELIAKRKLNPPHPASI